jgi:hypothetical protein
MSEKEPVCLECNALVWQGFLAHCIRILVPDSTFKDAIELGEAALAGATEEELREIDERQDREFDESFENKLMSIPYMVWRRKGKVHYYHGAPRNPEDCPFGGPFG